MTACRQKALNRTGAIVQCSLEDEHVSAGEHHFALDGLVEWRAFGPAPSPAGITNKRSALAASLLGSQETP